MFAEEQIGQYLSVSHRNDLYLYFSAKDNEVCVQFPLEIGSASVEITVQIEGLFTPSIRFNVATTLR